MLEIFRHFSGKSSVSSYTWIIKGLKISEIYDSLKLTGWALPAEYLRSILHELQNDTIAIRSNTRTIKVNVVLFSFIEEKRTKRGTPLKS